MLLLVALPGCEAPCPGNDLYIPTGSQVTAYEDCPDGQLTLCNEQTCAGEPGARYCESDTFYLGNFLMGCQGCGIEWDEEMALEVTCPEE